MTDTPTGTGDLVREARELLSKIGTDWRTGSPFFTGDNEAKVADLLPQLADALEAAERKNTAIAVQFSHSAEAIEAENSRLRQAIDRAIHAITPVKEHGDE